MKILSLRVLLFVAGLVFSVPMTATTILIDFGSTKTDLLTTAPGWNNVGTRTTTLTLVDVSGKTTPVKLVVESPFNTSGQGNINGTKEPQEAARDFPVSATRDSLFGNTALFSGEENRAPVLVFSGLDPALRYTFTYFASRTGNPVHDRTTDYTLSNGSAVNVKSLNAQDNHQQVSESAALTPSSAGTLTLSLSPGRTNSTAEGFTYLGVLKIERSPSASGGTAKPAASAK